nr:hypothetical protein [Borrelia puertoricensis]
MSTEFLNKRFTEELIGFISFHNDNFDFEIILEKMSPL